MATVAAASTVAAKPASGQIYVIAAFTPVANTANPLTIQVANLPKATTPDPHWTTFMQAIATPIVALLAGFIAYQQWRTAKNKLKVDVFDKRIDVYEAAIELTTEMSHPGPVEWSKISEIGKRMSAAHWVFSPAVSKHLNGRVERAHQTILRPKVKPEGMTDEEKMAAVLKAVQEAKALIDKEWGEINVLMSPYLALKH